MLKVAPASSKGSFGAGCSYKNKRCSVLIVERNSALYIN